VSPRGVVVEGLRERLFAAAAAVLARDGPAALTGRAVTREADCATGLLYNHFGDLDRFLAEFVLDRLRPLAADAAALPGRAGRGTVAGNLTDFALARLGPGMLDTVRLALARPALLAAVPGAAAAERTPLGRAEAAVTGYLDAERRLGRVGPGADLDAVALALVGTLHHLLLGGGDGDPADRVRGVVAILVDAIVPT
jgi:AcrR family transcriptional regulator